MKRLFAVCLLFLFLFFSAQQYSSVETVEDYAPRGCGDFRVLRKVEFEGKKNTFVILNFRADKIKLGAKFKKLRLKDSKIVSGLVEILNSDSEDNYCTDAIRPGIEAVHSLKIESGTVWVRKVKDEKELRRYGKTPYVVDVTLENAWFRKDGKKYYLKKIRFRNILVSMIMG